MLFYLPKNSSGTMDRVIPRIIPRSVIAERACSTRKKSSSIIPKIRKTLNTVLIWYQSDNQTYNLYAITIKINLTQG